MMDMLLSKLPHIRDSIDTASQHENELPHVNLNLCYSAYYVQMFLPTHLPRQLSIAYNRTQYTYKDIDIGSYPGCCGGQKRWPGINCLRMRTNLIYF